MSTKTLNQKTSMASYHNRMDAEIENPNISSGLATLKKTINNTREDSVLKNQNFGDGIVLEVSSEMIEYNFFGMNARKEDASSKKLKGYLCKIMPHYDVLPSPSEVITDPIEDRQKYLEMCHLYSTYAPLSDANRAPRMGEPVKIIKQNGLIGSNGEQIDGFYEVLTQENSFFDETDDLLNSLRNVYDKIKNYFGFSQETGKVQDLEQGDTSTSSGPSGGSVWTPEGEFEPDWPSPIVDSFYSVPRFGIKETAQQHLRKDPLKTAIVLHITDGNHEGPGTESGVWIGWRGDTVGLDTFKKNNNTTYSQRNSTIAVHYYVTGDGFVRQTVKEKYQCNHDNNGKNSIGIEIHGAYTTIINSSKVIKAELGEDTKGRHEGRVIRRFPTFSNDSDAKSIISANSAAQSALIDKRESLEKNMLSGPDPGNSLNLVDIVPKKKPMQKGNNSFVNPYFMDPFWPWNENTKFNLKMQKLVTLVYCLCKRYQIPMTSDSIFVKMTDHLRSGYHAGNATTSLHVCVTSYFWWKLFLKALQNFDESKLPESARTAFTAGTETPKDAIDEVAQVSLQEYCLENTEDPVCADVKSSEETSS